MTIATWYSRCALSLAVLAIIAYSTASRAPEFAVLAVPAVITLWRLSCRKGGSGRFLLPRFVVNILLFAVLAYAALRAQGRLEVGTIAQVVVLIQIIKIGDRRAPRDDAQILCLAVFLAIAAMLDSNDVWTGVTLMMFLPLLVTTVMLFQIHQGAVHAGAAGGGEGESAGAPPINFRRGLRVTSGVATVGTVAMALVVFVLLPRGIGENVFGSIGVPRSGRETGFTSSVTLGARGIISTSSTIVLDLVVKDDAGGNMGSPDAVQYLRGAVLTEYESRKWTAARASGTVGGQDATLSPGEEPFLVGPGTGPIALQTISMRSTPRGDQWMHLFALWRPRHVAFARSGTLRYNTSNYVLQRRAEAGPFEYTVWSIMHEAPRAGEQTRTPVAFDSPRLQDLAASILVEAAIDPDPATRPIEDDGRASRAIQDYLRTKLSYTLDQESPPRDMDPVEYFLFDRKKGHCEYFASAMVLLCRTVGINARMITGYIATEFSGATGAYIVRESNAHAWVEAEDGGRRWRRFDPTPPADLARIHRPAVGILGRLRHALEAVEYAWNSSIVAFNERTRQSLLGPSRADQVGWLGRIDQVSRRVRSPRLMVSALLMGISVFAGVAACGVVLRYVFRLALRFWGVGPREVAGRGPVLPGFYRRLLKALARSGVGKPAWRPPLEHSEVLRRVDGPLAADVRRVVDAYYAQRFSGRALSAQERGEMEKIIRRIRKFRTARA